MSPLLSVVAVVAPPCLFLLGYWVRTRLEPRARGGSADWHAGYDVGRDEGFGDGWRGGYAAGMRGARLAGTPNKARQDRKG